ncbi:MAG: hypothetical protein EOO16_15135 [Chitinophagaceae bacterium]|nr:MAG: hypothetical protein EOO16_15135 [Chitinophagaceae bacterium]
MKTPQRFQFWKIFWVLLALYVGSFLLAILLTSVTPASAMKGVNWRNKFTWAYVGYTVGSLIFHAGYYYFTLNPFYRRYNDRSSILSFVKICLAATAVLIGYFYAAYYLEPQEQMRKDMNAAMILFSYSFAVFFYLGIPLLISYLVYLRDERKQQKILEEQKMQLEFEKSQANFNFLKAQINPHFLHNTLNFLYAKALPLSEELSEGILTLSDIMRYALSQGHVRDGKAPLKDEIEHVQNVIKINQLRYNNKLNVRFDVEGVVNGAQIIPFALITIVENAFKHGDFKSPEHPITILIKIGKEGIYFSCSNRKKSGPKELGNGIGLENIRKRLELAYGEAFRYEVKEDADIYVTELTIYQL